MRQFLTIVVLLSGSVLCGDGQAAGPATDIRILFDVSAAMAQNDPANSRSAALKLIGGILPEDSSAGIWTFGRYVNNDVKWGRVDESWREAADRAAAQIHSSGRYVNIAKALQRASFGWSAPDASSRRSILLLSGSKIRVSGKPEKNDKARQSILGKTLKSLKASGARVYAIASSQSADLVLLRRLAAETGGSFAFVPASGDLIPVVSQMMEQMIEPDLVPLEANRFTLDESVSQITLLVFRSDNSAPTRLISPGNQVTTALKPGSAVWRRASGFDLIRLRNPATGSWRIDAEAATASRVLVETDLALKLIGQPRLILPTDGITLAAELYRGDEQLSKYNFLRFVDFRLSHLSPGGKLNSYTMKPSASLQDKGRYLFRGQGNLAEGRHRFSVTATGADFSRSRSLVVEVRWPVELVIEAGVVPGSYDISLSAREAYIRSESLRATIELAKPDGSLSKVDMASTGQRLIARLKTGQPGIYRLHIKVTARGHDAEAVDIDLGERPLQGLPIPVSPTSAGTID